MLTPREWAIRSRRAQGLPDHITDPTVLDMLASWLLADEAEPTESDWRAAA